MKLKVIAICAALAATTLAAAPAMAGAGLLITNSTGQTLTVNCGTSNLPLIPIRAPWAMVAKVFFPKGSFSQTCTFYNGSTSIGGDTLTIASDLSTGSLGTASLSSGYHVSIKGNGTASVTAVLTKS
jgi:hypothetical protein